MYTISNLKNLVTTILKKNGLKKNHSLICADAIINAELVGASSHGISRLSMYCNRIKKGLINPKAKIKIKKISNSIFKINANNSLGFIAADQGIKIAIQNAKKHGIAMVGISNSNHYGLSSYYIEQVTKKNLIALCLTNAPPAIAPYGAKKSLFGTNPIAFGVPIKNKAPFIFDSSMSKINRGKIRVAAKLGEKIPYGVALDKNGIITTNALKALKGVQLPISSFRGSGLAWMIDILCGVFTGSAHGGKVKDPFDDLTGPQNLGHLFIVFKTDLFVKNFSERLLKNIDNVKKLPKIKGTKTVFYPGERKYKRFKKNLKRKIYIPKSIIKELEFLRKE